jgi:hypothetical protein
LSFWRMIPRLHAGNTAIWAIQDPADRSDEEFG